MDICVGQLNWGRTFGIVSLAATQQQSSTTATGRIQLMPMAMAGLMWQSCAAVLTFSPMIGSTNRMTGLVAFAKALILARSVMTLTGRNLAVATIAQFQNAATAGAIS